MFWRSIEPSGNHPLSLGGWEKHELCQLGDRMSRSLLRMVRMGRPLSLGQLLDLIAIASEHEGVSHYTLQSLHGLRLYRQSKLMPDV